MKTETIPIATDLKNSLVQFYQDHFLPGKRNEPAFISSIREESIRQFIQLEFPHQKMENWRSTSLAKALDVNYTYLIKPEEKTIDISKIFKCDVHHLDTHLLTLLNGYFVSQESNLQILDDGTIMGSLAKATELYPGIVEKYYGKIHNTNVDGLHALNSAFAQDGFFIYIPDNTNSKKTIQFVNILNFAENVFINPRNLIIIGKNSSLQLVHCDHSIDHKISFINSATEIFLDDGAILDHYKLQNIDNDANLINSTYIRQATGSRLTSNLLTLNGGLIRNNLRVNQQGPDCMTDLYGIYLVDKEQHVDNNIFVDHQAPDCSSSQLFKGILDDQAHAVFNGHIHVARNSQRITAYQNNKNILLTDKANIHTQPHLEIYADDVKCSHGATVGQLDQEALFYMRSRGIREDNARMLLMYAFAAEVINKIKIQALRHQIDEMVYRRLRGELGTCDQCILDCNANRPINIEIDESKI